jgi:plastocyanin
MRRAHQLSLSFATTALALAACSAAGEPLSDEELLSADVIVVADDLAYVDPPTELPAGERRVALVNQGRAPHDLSFEGDLGTVLEVSGRGDAIGTVVLHPGTYVVYCDIAGHRDAGMEFRLTVT